jgi:hypothetical protein
MDGAPTLKGFPQTKLTEVNIQWEEKCQSVGDNSGKYEAG